MFLFFLVFHWKRVRLLTFLELWVLLVSKHLWPHSVVKKRWERMRKLVFLIFFSVQLPGKWFPNQGLLSLHSQVFCANVLLHSFISLISYNSLIFSLFFAINIGNIINILVLRLCVFNIVISLLFYLYQPINYRWLKLVYFILSIYLLSIQISRPFDFFYSIFYCIC